MTTTMNKTICKEAGIGLISIAFLILVLGFMSTAAVYLYQNYDVVADDQTSVDNSRTVQDAIMAFVGQQGRYPCPAPLNASIDSSDYGKEKCTVDNSGIFAAAGRDTDIPADGTIEDVLIGAVPTRTLGLSDTMMVDGYGKRFVYAVTERMADGTGRANTDYGAISIVNDSGQSITEPAGHAVFALLNFNGDDRGAFDIDGNLIEPCETGTLAGNNCAFLDGSKPAASFMTTMSKSFGTGSNAFEHNYAFHTNDVVYKWNTSPWDTCAGVCNKGTQNRTAVCEDIEGQVVDDAFCSHTARPFEGPQDCALEECRWSIGGYGTCNAGGNSLNPQC